MTVEEAAEFFKAVPRVRETFKTLHRVGLDYIHVGQQATTLSGGEAQRVKLAKELSKRATGRTLYILDEPTTGLHFHDVKKLLEVLHELVSQGNTVVVIEHNLEVIKTADWVIDLGPEGGDGGGEIVAWGPPEDIVKAPRSYTGKFLGAGAGEDGEAEEKRRERGGGVSLIRSCRTTPRRFLRYVTLARKQYPRMVQYPRPSASRPALHWAGQNGLTD